MQVEPFEQVRIPTPHPVGRKCVTPQKESLNTEGEKRDSIPPIRQNDKVSDMYSAFDNQSDCIIVGSVPSISTRIRKRLYEKCSQDQIRVGNLYTTKAQD